MAVDGYVTLIIPRAHGEIAVEDFPERNALAVAIPRLAWEQVFWKHLTEEVTEPEAKRSELAQLYRDVLRDAFQHLREMGFVAPELLPHWQRSMLAMVRVALEYEPPKEEPGSLSEAREKVVRASLAWAKHQFGSEASDPGWDAELAMDMLTEAIRDFASLESPTSSVPSADTSESSPPEAPADGS